MDGFSGSKTASAEELPDAVEILDLFHVVKPVGDALDESRRVVQQETSGHRSRVKDLLYRSRTCMRVPFAHDQAAGGARETLREPELYRSRSRLGRLPRHRERLPNHRSRREQEGPASSHRRSDYESADRTDRAHGL